MLNLGFNGEKRQKRRGRKTGYDPKNRAKYTRMSDDDLEILAELRKETGLNDSEIMRRSLRDWYLWKVCNTKPW